MPARCALPLLIVLAGFSAQSSAAAEPAFAFGGTVTTTADGAKSIYPFWDLDGDGPVDLVVGSAGDDTISWFKNNGSGFFGAARVVTTEAVNLRSVYVTWVDEDDEPDIVVADDGGVAWYRNQLSETINPDWSERQIVGDTGTGAHDIVLGDITGDGFFFEIIAVSKDDDAVISYEYDPEMNSFSALPVSMTAEGPTSVFLADIDGDDWLDVVVGSEDDDRVVWHRYRHRQGIFNEARLIADSVIDPTSVFSVDIDDDGFLDVLSSSSGDNTIAWYRNRVKEATDDFAPAVVINDSAIGATSVFSFDIDDDGDRDVLSSSAGDDKISFYLNLDGKGKFGPRRVITNTADGAQQVVVDDISRDGRMDVIYASAEDDTVAWYRGLPEPGAAIAAYVSLCVVSLLRSRKRN